MSLYENKNVDNIFNRSVIAGLLNLLNNRIKYKQVWDDNVVEEVTVPFAYNFANNKHNQDFIQDNYTFFGRECFSDKFIDGNFDMLPRFALKYSGSQIDANYITNRFIKGQFMKEENGKMTTYTAFLYSIPLTLNFELEGWMDNYSTAFKIEQAIREEFYKNQTFFVLYRGMKIRCCAGFPEQVTNYENTVNYSFEQDTQLKMTFNLSVECYQPCFDESTAVPYDNYIKAVGFDANIYNKAITPLDRDVVLKLNPIDTTRTYTTGQTLTISWTYKSNTSDVSSVLLYYKTSDGDRHMIACPSDGTNEYDWRVPATISLYDQPDVVFIENVITVKTQPVVRVAPDINGIVGTGNFVIYDAGDFSDDGYIQLSCEFVDSASKMNVHDCYVGEIVHNKLVNVYYYEDVEEKFEIMNKKKLQYNKGSYKTPITIGIMYPVDESVFDEIHNVLIV